MDSSFQALKGTGKLKNIGQIFLPFANDIKILGNRRPLSVKSHEPSRVGKISRFMISKWEVYPQNSWFCVFLFPHQMKSPQWEQNVGCLRNVAMNLCELTWWTLRFMAPRRCLSLKPFSCSLNWRMGWDCSSWVAHCSSIFTWSWPWGSRSTWKRCENIHNKSGSRKCQLTNSNERFWRIVLPIKKCSFRKGEEVVSLNILFEWQ